MKNSISLTLMFVLVLWVQSTATIIEVPNQYSSIQAGINASIDGDTVLVDADTYVENIDFSDRSIVLCSKFLTTGDTTFISSTIIDGNSAGSVVTVVLNEDSTTALVGFTLQNGNATNGGGINFNANGLTLSNLVIKNNTASTDGGGIYLSPAYSSENINIIDCDVIDNISGANGGGIYSRLGLNCLLTISHCRIENNTTEFKGGGMYSRTASSITSTSFINNTVQSGTGGGGGFCGENVVFSIDSSTFDGNFSVYGGAISLRSVQSTNIGHCLFIGNSGTHSSCIHLNQAPNDSLVIDKCTFSNNHSIGNLGALNLQSKCTVRNSIFSNNTSDGTCGGITFFGSPSISYCDVFSNQPSDFQGAIPVGLGELVDVNLNSDSCDVFQNILKDPLFCDTASGDYQLAETSPCLGAGESGADIGDLGIGCVAVDVEEYGDGSNLPYLFELKQSYPNPFNPVTTIEYSVPRRSHVKIEVFNTLGQSVRTLVDREESVGSYTISWDGSAVASGVYLYKLTAGDLVETKKMVLMK
jgi:hypothetical protein